MGAGDTFRAAAIEQLEIWSERADVPMIKQKHGSDPAAVAFDTIEAAVARDSDVVLIDTAGRLHTKGGLMDELSKMKRIMSRKVPDAPHEVLLVLDASTGQNAIRQAEEFTKSVDVTGLALTKLDGTAKGGVVIGVSHQFQVPVKYIGVGEGIDDLQVFDRKGFVEALFGE
jgi:fused signal recognition particle receptor